MYTPLQKESRAPATCFGSATTQDVGSSHQDGLERECPRNTDRKLPGLYGVGDPTAMFSSDSSCLSSRGKVIKWFWDSAEEGYRTYHMDQYDEDKNPSGIINLGTSENKLCFDLLSRRLSQSDMLRVEPSLLQYPDWRGHPFLREEVAKFLSYYCKSPAPLKPENVVVLNGGASVFSALATVLCEAGEAFLIPTPYYGAITQHVYLYGNVRLAFVYLDSEVTGLDTRPFQLTVEKLELALQGAKSEGVKVKGLILINPQNPLGNVYSPRELQEFLGFAARHKLHVIVDEVYMLSVFEESLGYRSVLGLKRWSLGTELVIEALWKSWDQIPGGVCRSDLLHPVLSADSVLQPHGALEALPETLRITAHVADWTWPGAAVCCFLLLWISGHKRLPDPQRTHVMWATSKDFGMSGLRFGTLYTENRDVATAVASLCRYHGLSGLLQFQMAQLLRDRDWINQVYLPENHSRLKAAHTYVSGELRALGVPFLSGGAGFFLWVDLRKVTQAGGRWGSAAPGLPPLARAAGPSCVKPPACRPPVPSPGHLGGGDGALAPLLGQQGAAFLRQGLRVQGARLVPGDLCRQGPPAPPGDAEAPQGAGRQIPGG
ncbi:1-aminocyclopropane-1-carboxylate synthase-like protein 1 isoform X1 [Cavia porcellus]|uniref:1-aminocyclopropane-1-carboxylate synthase-like protein 1 isoform X1 n=1 Tax=Cavia porcellus TaxID=10141 RepID=UPI002FE12455